MHETTRGLVLREVAYREADMMLTILTESGEKVSACARGVRRKNSKLSAAVQSLAYSEFTLFVNGTSATVNEAEAIELFFTLRSDLTALALASYFAECLEVTADAEVRNPELLRLGLNCLYALTKGGYDPRLVKAAFELRIARYAGYAPLLGELPPHPVFSMEDGALRAATDPGGRACPVNAGVVDAIRHILFTDLKKLLAFSLPEDGVRILATLAEEYLLTHFERTFKTLGFYHELGEFEDATI